MRSDFPADRHYRDNRTKTHVDKDETSLSYSFSDAATVEVMHKKGDRWEDEDTDFTFENSRFHELSPDERKYVVLEASRQTDAECKKQTLDGACVGLVIAWVSMPDEKGTSKLFTCTANAGDVSSFFTVTEESKVTTVKQLNQLTHSVNELGWPGDALYYNGFVCDNGIWRTHETMMIYRSFGDYDTRNSAEVDYVEHEFTLTSGQIPRVIVGCDGLTEGMFNLLNNKYLPKDKKDISFVKYKEKNVLVSEFLPSEDDGLKPDERFIKRMLELSLEDAKSDKDTVKNLVDWAYCSSFDNISASLLRPGKLPVCIGIVDGHSGKECAVLISQIFQKNFALAIVNVFNKRKANAEWKPFENFKQPYLGLPDAGYVTLNILINNSDTVISEFNLRYILNSFLKLPSIPGGFFHRSSPVTSEDKMAVQKVFDILDGKQIVLDYTNLRSLKKGFLSKILMRFADTPNLATFKTILDKKLTFKEGQTITVEPVNYKLKCADSEHKKFKSCSA